MAQLPAIAPLRRPMTPGARVAAVVYAAVAVWIVDIVASAPGAGPIPATLLAVAALWPWCSKLATTRLVAVPVVGDLLLTVALRTDMDGARLHEIASRPMPLRMARRVYRTSTRFGASMDAITEMWTDTHTDDFERAQIAASLLCLEHGVALLDVAPAAPAPQVTH